jgi:putative flippase GtrA
MVRFAIVGVANTVVDVTIFWILQSLLDVPYLLANVVSYSAGTLNSFVLNKTWTFSETRDEGSLSRQLPIFVVVNLFSLALSSVVLAALAQPIGVMPAKGVTLVVTFFSNFWGSRTFVYKSTKQKR